MEVNLDMTHLLALAVALVLAVGLIVLLFKFLRALLRRFVPDARAAA